MATEEEIRKLCNWSLDIHEWALDKGWWEDVNRNVGEIILLFVGEVSETFEEWRDGRPMTLMYFNQEDARRPIVLESQNIPERINPKPEGIPVELADIFIRMLDVVPMWEIDLESWLTVESQFDLRWGNLYYVPANRGHALMQIVREFGVLYDFWTSGFGVNSPTFGRQFARIILMLLQLCDEWKIDIFRYIDIKHEYNKTRSHRHGGKLA